MLFLRIIGILAVIAIGAGVVTYLLTGDRRYLSMAGRIAKYALILALGLFVLLAFERLIVIF
ncbi:MAG: hypothetical protein Q7U85_03760 [Rhodocyclaceae bacterium]|nr:hypothetical protein [Rhodocyclaceae bacterium]